MQSGEERLELGCSKEVEMSWGSEDLRGTWGSVSCTWQVPPCPPGGHSRLKGYLPPSLEWEPDRILMGGRWDPESNRHLWLYGTLVSCASAPSGKTISSPNNRAGISCGWAVSIPKPQHREQKSHQMSGQTKIARHKIKSDSWQMYANTGK